MATLPTFFRKNHGPAREAPKPAAPRLAPDPYRLRALPHEDVIFFCKQIDNSRLVREPDPRARGAEWRTIGAACVLLCTLTGVLIPSVANTRAGYRLEALHAEERRLLEERRALELQEAWMLNPARLEELAGQHQLAPPRPGQVDRLDGAKTDSSLALAQQ